VGRFTHDQLYELADLAERYGSCEVRLTNEQNVLIANVPDAKLPALLAEPLLQEWSPTPSGVLRGLVTCTGEDYCHFALNDTKGISLSVARELEKRFPDTDKVVHLNVSGCIHACGRHRATELGLLATRIRQGNGEIVDGFDIFVGGQLGEHAQLAEEKHSNATVGETIELLALEIAAKYARQSPYVSGVAIGRTIEVA
jgi:ferredoxin-nitrite reductase